MTWRTALPRLLATALALVVIAGVVAHGPVTIDRLINADTLYAAAIYQDLFVDHYPIRDWSLTAAPYFFPDMAIMFLCLWVTPEIGFAYVLSSLVFLLLISLAFVDMARQLVRKPSAAWILGFAGGAILATVFLDPLYGLLAKPVYSPTAHTGAFVIGVALLAIALRAARRGYSRVSWIAYLALSTLTIASDPLIVFWFLLPISITTLAFAIVRWIPLRTCLHNLAATGAASLGALGILSALQALDFFHWSPPRAADVELSGVVHALTQPELVLGYLRLGARFPTLGWVFAAWVLVSSAWCFDTWRRSASSEPVESGELQTARLALFLIGASAFSIPLAMVGPLVNGLPAILFLRYLQPLYLLPVLIVPLLIGAHRLRASYYVALGLCGLVTLLASFRILPRLSSVDLAGLGQPHPERIRCLDEVRDRFSLASGYGTYWDNKYMTMLSRSRGRVNLIKLPEFMPWHAKNNQAWYRRSPGGGAADYPRYDFFVSDGDWATGAVEGLFGSPAAWRSCGERTFMIYNRASDVAFRNRIRIPAVLGDGPRRDQRGRAIRGSTSVPMMPARPNASGILCARNHRTYVVDGSRLQVDGSVLIPRGRRLSIDFDDPIRAEILEMSGLGDRSYRVLFRAGKQRLGVLRVPRNGGAALRIRYLRLPESVSGRSFDRLTIVPSATNAHSKVGHICFYDDSVD